MSPTDNQTMASTSISRPNIGPIVGGVVAGVVVGVALIWYLRRRSQQTSMRGLFPFLRWRSGANVNAPPRRARTQELPGFHYYALSDRSSQVFSSSLPTSGAVVPQAQAPATAGPPNSSYHVAENRVQGQIPSEPVEEGLMSSRRRGRYP